MAEEKPNSRDGAERRGGEQRWQIEGREHSGEREHTPGKFWAGPRAFAVALLTEGGCSVEVPSPFVWFH